MLSISKPPFLIDTKTACFMCLRECNENSLNKLFSFRTLSRYLKINLEKTLGSNYGDQTILLCPQCFIEAQKFSKLHQELEVTKMLIYSSLQKIHAAMMESQRNGVRMGRYKEIMQPRNVGGVSQFQFVEGVRQEIMTKCRAKTRKAVPRINVRKMDDVDVSSNPNSSASSKKRLPTSDAVEDFVEFETLPLQTIIKEEEEQEQPAILSTYSLADNPRNDETSRDIVLEKELELSPPTSVTTDAPVLQMEDSLTNYGCEYCSKTFSEMSFVQNHVIGCHSDQLFVHYKHPSLTEIQFKVALERFLYESIHRKKANNFAVRKAKCDFCEFMVNQTDKFSLPNHLIKEHFDTLAEQLLQFQEQNFNHFFGLIEGTPNEIIQKMFVMSGTKPNGSELYACTVCGSQMQKDTRLNHVRGHGNCMIRCEYCDEWFIRNNFKAYHELTKHCEVVLQSLNIHSFPKHEFTSSVLKTLDRVLDLRKDLTKKNRCPFCPNLTFSRNDKAMLWRQHMMTTHYEYMAQKIVAAQNRKKSKDIKVTNQRIAQTMTLEANSGSSSSILANYQKCKCAKCGAMVLSCNLNRHHKSVSCKRKGNWSLFSTKTVESGTTATPRNRRVRQGKCDMCGATMLTMNLYRHKTKHCLFRGFNGNPSSTTGSQEYSSNTVTNFPTFINMTPSTSLGQDLMPNMPIPTSNFQEANNDNSASTSNMLYTLLSRIEEGIVNGLNDETPLTDGQLNNQNRNNQFNIHGGLVGTASTSSNFDKCSTTITEPEVVLLKDGEEEEVGVQNDPLMLIDPLS